MSAHRSPRRFAAAPLVLACLFALFVATTARVAEARPDGSYPLLANIDWTNEPNAVLNSRYDLVFLSTRATTAKFDSIRALNPAAKVLVTPAWYTYYDSGPSEYPPIYGPFSASDPNYGFDRRMWDLLNDNNWWSWAVDSSGVRWHGTAFWGMWMGNFSSKAPRNAQGKRLCDLYADFVIDNMVIPKGADGVFFDNLWDSPGWLNWQMGGCKPNTNCAEETPGTKYRTAFDLDNNGQPDPADSLLVWWRTGIETMFARFRERMGPDFIIMGNGMHKFTTANGAMHERFPRIHNALDPAPNPWNFRWQDSMFGANGYLTQWPTRFSGPVHNLIHTELGGGTRFAFPTSATHQQLFRFNFGSTLLGDGYFTLNSGYYGCYYWQPEYDLRLGWPRGPAYKVTINGIDIWRRDFTNGEVWVNPRDIPLSAGATHPAVGAWDAAIRERADTVGSGGPPPVTRGAIHLAGGQPNPSTGSGTTLTFALDVGETGQLDVLDLRGRTVRTLWQGEGTGEAQSASWDGRSDEGWVTPSGVYFVILTGEDGRTARQKLVRVP